MACRPPLVGLDTGASKVSKCCKYVYWAKIDGGNCCSFSLGPSLRAGGVERSRTTVKRTIILRKASQFVILSCEGMWGFRDFCTGGNRETRDWGMSDSIFRNAYQDVKRRTTGRTLPLGLFFLLLEVRGQPSKINALRLRENSLALNWEERISIKF